MGIREIRKNDDEILRKKSKPVSDYNQRLSLLFDDMEETLALANGVGLAGPQVGVLRQVVVLDLGTGDVDENDEIQHNFLDMCNPQILEQSGEQVGREGCLSLPGICGLVKRPMKVKASFFDRHGVEQEIEAEGLIARAICHETDHLMGRLYTDVAEKMLTREELEAEDYGE